MTEEIKENIMGYEAIPKLIMKLSLPLMLSMLIQALYNIVDSIFVSRVSEASLTAVSLAFPLQNLMIAFAVGTAVGVNSYLARKLGEGDRKEAEHTAGNGLFLSLLTWAAFALFGIIGAEPFMALFTDDPQLLALATGYTKICLIFSLGIFIDITAERIMQATGDSIHPMITQMAGAVTNIILDPVFIFIFGMDVYGAAIATVIGQFVSMFLALYFVRDVYRHAAVFKFHLRAEMAQQAAHGPDVVKVGHAFEPQALPAQQYRGGHYGERRVLRALYVYRAGERPAARQRHFVS